MFEDYRRYITNIRNSLIQCGVEFPISPLETYGDLFHESFKLDDVLWYYSVLAISGSDEALRGFILPLNGYYKKKMRQVFYSEYNDFIKDYRRISKTYSLLNGYEGSIDIVNTYSPLVNEPNVEEEEVIDLFEEDEISPSISEVPEDTSILEKEEVEEQSYTMSERYSCMVDLINNEPEEEELEDALYSSDLDDLLNEFLNLNSKEFVEHGIYLDELSEEDMEEEQPQYDSASNEEGLNDGDFVEHGIYLDELPEEQEEPYYEDIEEGSEPYYEELEEEQYYEGSEDSSDEPYYEEMEDEPYYEGMDEEDGNESSSEELEEPYYEDIEDEPYYEDLEDNSNEEPYYEEMEDEPYYEGMDEEIEDEPYYEDLEDSSNEEPYYEGMDEEIEDEPYYEGMEEEYYEDPSGSEPTSEKVQGAKEIKQTQQNSVKPKQQEKDLSDYLQGVTNSLLTKGKRFIYKEVKKLKED